MPTVTVGSPVFFVKGGPSPTLRKPLPNPPQGAGAPRKCFRHSRKEPPSLGEGWGGAFYRPVCIARDHHGWFVTDETWARDN